jgi:hypothetical protein
MEVSMVISDSCHGLAVGRGMSETEFREVWLEHARKPKSRNYVGNEFRYRTLLHYINVALQF